MRRRLCAQLPPASAAAAQPLPGWPDAVSHITFMRPLRSPTNVHSSTAAAVSPPCLKEQPCAPPARCRYVALSSPEVVKKTLDTPKAMEVDWVRVEGREASQAALAEARG